MNFARHRPAMANGGAGVSTRAQSAGSRPAAAASAPSKRAGAVPAARGPSPWEGAISRALDTFADLELASDDPFECEPAWFSDDDECLDDDDDDLLDDEEDDFMPRALRTTQLGSVRASSMRTSTGCRLSE